MLLRCSMSVRLVVGRKFPTTFHERSRSPSILTRDEDSRHQFKRGETSADNIAAELAAFANSGGCPSLHKPRSRLQQYRLTALGRRRLATHPGV